MTLNRLGREEEPDGNLRIAQPAGDQEKDVLLPACQARPVAAGRRPWSAGHSAHPELAKPAPAEVGSRAGTELVERGHRLVDRLGTRREQQRYRGFVPAAALVPPPLGAPPVAFDRERVRGRRVNGGSR